jgi:lipopolysaccharide assembly protein A
MRSCSSTPAAPVHAGSIFRYRLYASACRSGGYVRRSLICRCSRRPAPARNGATAPESNRCVRRGRRYPSALIGAANSFGACALTDADRLRTVNHHQCWIGSGARHRRLRARALCGPALRSMIPPSGREAHCHALFHISVIVLFIAATLLFAVQNFQTVTMSFLGFSARAPLALLVAVVYFVGMATGGSLLAVLRRSVQGSRRTPAP